MGVTYDTGVLIAAERGDHSTWKRHRGLLVLGMVPTIPAPVVAQAWRGGSRQARLAELMRGCAIEAMTEQQAREVGVLLGVAQHDDIVDGAVVEGAARREDSILTTDPLDIERLVAATGLVLAVDRI